MDIIIVVVLAIFLFIIWCFLKISSISDEEMDKVNDDIKISFTKK